MNRADKLTGWVKNQHKDQLIKRTDEPYINHLVAVADMASVIPLGYEIGLCHDLLEDTEVTATELNAALTGFDYTKEESNTISNCVIELTDVFTKKAYPKLKKTDRKDREARRLATISPAAQTVKYADLIYNINWMLKYKPNKTIPYLQKKQLLLATMTMGNQALRSQAKALINQAYRELMPLKPLST